MHTYSQSSGTWARNGKIFGAGYSGAGAGKNNPAMQGVPDVGPIPRGNWKLAALAISSNGHGPYVIHLLPAPETDTEKRSGFLIHGDNIVEPGTASKGCIILNRLLRTMIWESGDKDLVVTA